MQTLGLLIVNFFDCFYRLVQKLKAAKQVVPFRHVWGGCNQPVGCIAWHCDVRRLATGKQAGNSAARACTRQVLIHRDHSSWPEVLHARYAT
mmetsp:Transcript_152264/g.280151  ORF Transcript_152264/g.280151 Transcript_152264/m.280151 type:complete len:92 (-) Transcript_152264:51-326(-)